MNEIDRQVGENLRHAREALHMTVNDVVAQTSLDNERLDRIETGHCRATAAELFKLGAALKITARDIYAGLINGGGLERFPLR